MMRRKLTERMKSVFLLVSRYAGLFRLARAFNRQQLLILCYHGFQLRDEASWWPGVFISEEKFRQRLDIIRRYGFNVLSLDEAVDMMYSQQLPDNAMVITVDDGFKSTIDIFKPLMEQYNYPSTVYVTSYYSDKAVPIFRLVVQYMFWKTKASSVSLNGLNWVKEAGTVLDLRDLTACRRYTWLCIDYGESQCDEPGRQEILVNLGELLDVSYQDIVDSGICTLMNKQELMRYKSALTDIQIHTHRHNFPAEPEIATKEIQDNIVYLAQVTDANLVHFCYPSGIWEEAHKSILQASGIKTATTCDIGFNDYSSNPYALKRYIDQENITLNEFLSEICGYSKIVRNVRDWIR